MSPNLDKLSKRTLQGHNSWIKLSELWGIYFKLWTKACRVFLEVCDALSPALLIPSSMEFKYPCNADEGFAGNFSFSTKIILVLQGFFLFVCSNSLYKTFVLISSVFKKKNMSSLHYAHSFVFWQRFWCYFLVCVVSGYLMLLYLIWNPFLLIVSSVWKWIKTASPIE